MIKAPHPGRIAGHVRGLLKKEDAPYIFPLCKKHPHMDRVIRDRFITLWQGSCPGAELPLTFEVGADNRTAERAQARDGWRCIICDLARVRKGNELVTDRSDITCSGGLFYMGYEAKRS
jgi:uncharacterized protein (DUF169 family)